MSDPVPGVDEQQRITISGNPNGGTYLLGFRGQMCNPALRYNANDAAMTAALTALTGVGAGNLTVVKNTSGAGLFDVFFTNALGAQDVPLIDVDYTGLNRGSVAASVIVEGAAPSMAVSSPGHTVLGDMLTAQEQNNADAHAELVTAQLDTVAAKRASMATAPTVPASKRPL